MSNVAENEVFSENSESDIEGENEPPFTGESTPSSTQRDTTTENGDATSTESLGLESMTEKGNSASGDLAAATAESSSSVSPTTVESGAVGVESRSRRMSRNSSSSYSEIEMNYFPPILSTLSVNGRPRYDLVKNSENGRLQIHMVRNERPELVQSVEPTSGRLTLSLINGADIINQDHQVQDEMEDQADNPNEENKEEGCSGTGNINAT